MKHRIIFIAALIALLLLIGLRFSVVERSDVLPEEVRLGQAVRTDVAFAEAEPAASDPAHFPGAPTTAAPTPVTKESSAQTAEDFFMDKNPRPDEQSGEKTSRPDPAEARPVLQRGDRGDKVRALQQRLRDLGFLTGSADGIFGAQTEQAVIRFKRHLADLLTEALARAQETATTDPTTTADPTTTTDPTTTIDPAATADPTATADPATTANPPATAAPDFTGGVDEETYRLIAEQGFDEYQYTLRENTRGAEVRRLQEKLRSLGYLTGRADGIYGKQTARAVNDFQKRHKLTADGIAGEKTQRALFSASARRQVRPASPPKNGKYLLKVSTNDQRVYAYAWNEKSGAYADLARTMVCSTGLPGTPTPKGTYKSVGPVVEWGYFPKYDVWAQYLFRINGPYLFHSVLYDEADESTVKWGSVNKLGTPASHGCIRLKVEDARWIYRNCAAGTTVTVY